MQLPPELAPWADLLALFPPDLSPVVGGMIRPLSVALGAPVLRTSSGEEEPDGYDGLTNRGTHERLVPTEWLLATELPDEFLRRAAMNEQVHFRRRPIEHRATARSAVLFDGGIDQLGAPRIAHVALLILFARRAASFGATFSWGMLQRPDAGLREGIDAADMRALLDARTFDAVDDAMRARWRTQFASWKAHDDLWAVGGPGAHLGPRRVHRVTIDEPLDLGTKRLEVVVDKGRHRQCVTLDLPEPSVGARILKGPVDRTEIGPELTAMLPESPFPRESIVFSDDGHRIAVRLDDGRVADVPIPTSSRASMHRYRIVEPRRGSWIQAVDFVRKRLLYVEVGDALDCSDLVDGATEYRPMADCPIERDPRLYRAFRAGARTCFAALPDRTLELVFVHPRPRPEGKYGIAYEPARYDHAIHEHACIAAARFGPDVHQVLLFRNGSTAWLRHSEGKEPFRVTVPVATVSRALLAFRRAERAVLAAFETVDPGRVSYKALDPKGHSVTGVLAAKDEDAAVDHLRRQGLYPLSVKEEGIEGNGEYSYVATDRNGKQVRGIIAARDAETVVAKLNDMGFVPVEVKPGPRTLRDRVAGRSATSDVSRRWVLEVEGSPPMRASLSGWSVQLPKDAVVAGLLPWFHERRGGRAAPSKAPGASLVVLEDSGRVVAAVGPEGRSVLLSHPRGFVWATVHPSTFMFAGIAHSTHGFEVVVHDIRRDLPRLRLAVSRPSSR